MKGVLIIVIILAMVVVSSFVILINITSMMENSGDYNDFNHAKQNMANLDSTVRELLFESTGSSRDFSFNLNGGEFFSDEINNRFFVKIDTGAVDKHTVVREGSLTIERGPFVEAYESDVNSDGQEELVLENDAVVFAVSKKGSDVTPVYVDFEDIIKEIKVKQTGFSSAPIGRLFINSLNSTSGTGYTKITHHGIRLDSSSIIVHVDSGRGVYEAIFTLNAENDYIILTIDVL